MVKNAVILIPPWREKDLPKGLASRSPISVIFASIARFLGASRTGILLGMTNNFHGGHKF